MSTGYLRASFVGRGTHGEGNTPASGGETERGGDLVTGICNELDTQGSRRDGRGVAEDALEPLRGVAQGLDDCSARPGLRDPVGKIPPCRFTRNFDKPTLRSFVQHFETRENYCGVTLLTWKTNNLSCFMFLSK